MEKNETVYCGNGKEKKFDDGDLSLTLVLT